MTTETEHLKNLVLADVKHQLGMRYAVSLLRRKLELLANRVDAIAPFTDPEAIKIVTEADTTIETAFKDMEERTLELLAALEKYING